MVHYAIRRLLHSCLVLLAASIAVFLLSRLTGSPAALFLGPNSSAQDFVRVTHQLGLDRPLYVQYWIFFLHALHGNFGDSIWYEQPALQLVLKRVPATAELALTAFLLALAFGVPAGTYAALHRGRLGDWGVVTLGVFGQSIPVFVLAVLAVLLFSVVLHWLPSEGYGGISHLILPATTLAAFSAAKIMRMTRSTVLEVLPQQFVRTAYGKGLSKMRIVLRHVFRNAAAPIVTVAGLELGQLLSGVVITESIFGWPGLGQLAVEAIGHSDYPLIQADALVVAAMYIAVNFLVDISYLWLDPRITYF
jgi:peptide/nickel transport system permease protein